LQIKLNRCLQHRPSAETLVSQGVLPNECLQGRIAPSLISTRRRIEKERVKDILRHWIEEWGKKGSKATEGSGNESRPDVRILARRFARERDARETPRWGKGVEHKEMPTRAKVLGLRRFWEKVGKEGVAS
jgi:hypothetical protein